MGLNSLSTIADLVGALMKCNAPDFCFNGSNLFGEVSGQL